PGGVEDLLTSVVKGFVGGGAFGAAGGGAKAYNTSQAARLKRELEAGLQNTETPPPVRRGMMQNQVAGLPETGGTAEFFRKQQRAAEQASAEQEFLREQGMVPPDA